MSDRQPLGPLLDARGITASLDDGDLVADALVILRVVREDGTSYVREAWTTGMDFVARRGLIETARDIELRAARRP